MLIDITNYAKRCNGPSFSSNSNIKKTQQLHYDFIYI